MYVSQLYIYPIKSLGGISVLSAELTDRGLKHDRRWMLVDEQNQFMTQREYPQMALLQTAITPEGILVFNKSNISERILVPFSIPIYKRQTVKVWDDWCESVIMPGEINDWFSGRLGLPCTLVFMPDDSLRKVDGRYTIHENDITSFSDAFPLMLIGQASLDDLNSRLNDPLPMNRFRPNIVIAGSVPYEEDEMEDFMIGDIHFYGVKLCSRCVITTINQDSLEKGKEPLKTLAGYRMMNKKTYFGQNILYSGSGNVKTGDEIHIMTRKAKPGFGCLAGI